MITVMGYAYLLWIDQKGTNGITLVIKRIDMKVWQSIDEC